MTTWLWTLPRIIPARVASFCACTFEIPAHSNRIHIEIIRFIVLRFLLSFFQRAMAAALRQRDMARRATSPLLRSIIPAVMLFHTSFRV